MFGVIIMLSWDDLQSLHDRVTELQNQVSQQNHDINRLESTVRGLEDRLYNTESDLRSHSHSNSGW
jgi:peptidoglycan hydrolase CwlO-like protein